MAFLHFGQQRSATAKPTTNSIQINAPKAFSKYLLASALISSLAGSSGCTTFALVYVNKAYPNDDRIAFVLPNRKIAFAVVGSALALDILAVTIYCLSTPPSTYPRDPCSSFNSSFRSDSGSKR